MMERTLRSANATPNRHRVINQQQQQHNAHQHHRHLHQQMHSPNRNRNMRPQQQQQIKNNNHNQINMHNVDPVSAQNILRAHGVELKQLLNLVQHIPSSQQNQQRKANPNANNNIIVNGNP